MNGGLACAGLAAAGVAVLANHRAVRGAAATPDSLWVRTNHAGSPVTLAEGPIAAVALLAGLAVGVATGQPVRRSLAVAVAGAGAGAVGAYDDLFGSSESRGFRGHFGALRSGVVTSGLIKIVGVGLSAAVASSILRWAAPPRTRWVDLALDTALIAGTANLANLFDLRPGRAGKVILALSTPLAGSGAGPVLGAVLGSLPTDLGARSMMGDCGANALGAAVAVVATDVLPRPARLFALVGVTGLNLASERVSFTAVIERTPWLRWLDQLGRRAPA